MQFKKPRYFTKEEFVEFYPNLGSESYRDYLVYNDISIVSESIMKEHLEYLKVQDQKSDELFKKHGRHEGFPLTEVLDPEEIIYYLA